MSKLKIKVTLDENIWEDFFQNIVSGANDEEKFLLKIIQNHYFEGKYVQFGGIFTITKNWWQDYYQGKIVFGLERQDKEIKEIYGKWKLFLEKFSQKNNNIFENDGKNSFRNEELKIDCGTYRFELCDSVNGEGGIKNLKIAIERIFRIFYQDFFHVSEEEMEVIVGVPTNRYGMQYFDKKLDVVLPDWLMSTEKDEYSYTKDKEAWRKNRGEFKKYLTLINEGKIDDIQNNLNNNENFDWLQGNGTSRKKKQQIQEIFKDFNPDEIILSADIEKTIDLLVKQFLNKEHFQKFNAALPRGLILYGPPGTGKTTIAKVLAVKLKRKFYYISASEIISKWIGESALNMQLFFDGVEENSIVFIDEIDGLLPDRKSIEQEGSSAYLENVGAVNVFLEYLDGMKALKDVLFVGATNHIDSIDKSILRAGRLEKKIFVDFPDAEAREKLWKMYLEKTQKNTAFAIIDKNTNFEQLAAMSVNFTGADIKEIIRRIMSDVAVFSLNTEEKIIITPAKIFRGILYIIEKYKEEFIFNKGVIPEKEKVFLSDIGGQEELKSEIKKIIIQIKNRELFQEMNVDLPKGMLLYGPPGTGKTLAAKVIANETNLLFYMLLAKDFLGKNGIEGLEKQLSELQTPCIVFIDEIDAIGMHRSHMSPYEIQILNTLLQKMDGFASNSDIFFIAATNNFDDLDDALIRAGRFDIKIQVDLPDDEGRQEIFKIFIEKSISRHGKKLFEENINLHKLSEISEGLVGADIKEIIRRIKQKFIISLIEQNKIFSDEKITEQQLIDEIYNYMETKKQNRRIGFV